jgi:hypothetical protein
LNIATPVKLYAQLLERFLLRPQETESEENQLRWEIFLGSWHFFHLPASSTIFCPFNADGVQASKFAFIINSKVFRRNTVLAGV